MSHCPITGLNSCSHSTCFLSAERMFSDPNGIKDFIMALAGSAFTKAVKEATVANGICNYQSNQVVNSTHLAEVPTD